jgi:sulfite exporter TauE/SafE
LHRASSHVDLPISQYLYFVLVAYGLLPCQYLYFCTRNASSKLST